MIKGLVITPPVLGRISIGKVVERNNKRLPEKDDQFTITSQVQSREGWVLHPLDETLRKNQGKLRTIPIRLMFNDPDLNLRADYSLFDKSNGRPVCVGNGETCRRCTESGIQEQVCPSSDACTFGRGICKPYARLNVLIGQDDEFGSFVFRTTGYNSIRTLTARLNYYRAVSGDLLSCLPLELKLRGKSTTQSHRSAIYYADITIREGMTLEQAISEARSLSEHRQSVGHDQDALEAAARQGFANGAFEEGEDEIPAVLEEFYPDSEAGVYSAKVSSLADKLEQKVVSA